MSPKLLVRLLALTKLWLHIIKSVMGLPQILLRGLENVQNGWTLVCLAWNLKRMAVLRPQQENRTEAL